MNQETLKKLERLLIDNQECYKIALIRDIKKKKDDIEIMFEESPGLCTTYMQGISRGYANILEMLSKKDK